MTAAPSPPRLFVIFAARAHVAVVIRRGPSEWTRITSWNTDRDEFTGGAWFRGRILRREVRSSPDGQLLVVAAFQGRKLGTETTDAWTAVSRAPWLHALALWPMGTTYGGGGRFVDDRTLTLRGAGASHSDFPPRGLRIVDGPAPHHASTDDVEGAQWAGRDRRGRLVFARDGRLYARAGSEDRVLADFTGERPDPVDAPEWAKAPLR
ncbi:MAG: hypothetical protein U0169_04755 [Polyangiaceae bacterium]